ncbi:ankyrin repeat-containing protein At5g02620 [Eucalyptus grandis]|uniref:ankyrin repeat-containing protein At5g02620 n=1 Tax=Eucalyptus grandis TaxID=71139 RepID=UPI00192F060F|nr:ankyrin repeat-containing protein At5g02620 [Eucalyptus grandis]
MVTDGDLVNAQDDEGNTILHLAATNKQIETVKYLLQRSEVDVNTMNRNGFSALNIVEHFPKDFKVIELRELLVHAGALRAVRFSASTTHQAVVDNTNEKNSTVEVDIIYIAPPPSEAVPPPSFSGEIRKQKEDKHEKWIMEKHNSLMIIAAVIRAMAYQASLSPPDGLWNDDQKYQNGTIYYYAGTSIMAANNPEASPFFWTCNTVSFLASLSTIFLLMSGLPLGKKVLMWILTATMWMTITFMGLTYVYSMTGISFVQREPKDGSPTTEVWYSADWGTIMVIRRYLTVWSAIVNIVFLVHTVRFLAIVLQNVKDPQKLKKWISVCVSWYRSRGNIKI